MGPAAGAEAYARGEGGITRARVFRRRVGALVVSDQYNERRVAVLPRDGAQVPPARAVHGREGAAYNERTWSRDASHSYREYAGPVVMGLRPGQCLEGVGTISKASEHFGAACRPQ